MMLLVVFHRVLDVSFVGYRVGGLSPSCSRWTYLTLMTSAKLVFAFFPALSRLTTVGSL